MYKILSPILVAFCLILFTQVTPSQALVIPGPVLDQNESGHSDFGLIIRAEQNTNLVSVRYPNQGQADVIELRLHSDGTLLTSIPTPAGNTNIVVNINYPLTAGETYRLIATTTNNRNWTNYNDFPTGNSEIAVLSSLIGSSEYSIYWASFNDITTESGITLVKTVGTTPGVCAGTDEITVPAGTTVYYCYTVTNNGNITLNLHDLVDDQLGTIFSGLNYALAPGESVSTVAAGLSIPVVINTNTTNTATWTAYNAGPTNQDTAQASATVLVEVIPPSATVTVEVGPSGGGTVAGGGVFNIDDSATVEAFPDAGWTFVHWENSPNPPIPDNPYTFTVTGDTTLTAIFARQEAVVPIPTMSEWGMIIMALILTGSAIWMMRRRQVS